MRSIIGDIAKNSDAAAIAADVTVAWSVCPYFAIMHSVKVVDGMKCHLSGTLLLPEVGLC